MITQPIWVPESQRKKENWARETMPFPDGQPLVKEASKCHHPLLMKKT